jgi:hypothetical protein
MFRGLLALCRGATTKTPVNRSRLPRLRNNVLHTMAGRVLELRLIACAPNSRPPLVPGIGQSHFITCGRLWPRLKAAPDGDAPKSLFRQVAALMPIGKQNPTYPSFLVRSVHQDGRTGYRA